MVPVRFIGANGHGVVYLDRAEAGLGTDPAGWRFGLARLTRAVPAQLQNMALTGQRLVVPGTEQHRFRDEFYPRLRQMAILTSSDGSFTPPVVSDPTLILQASYGPGHDVVVNWDVGVPGRRLPVPGGAAPGPRRDRLPEPGPNEPSWTACHPTACSGRPSIPGPARRPGHHAVHHRDAADARRPPGSRSRSAAARRLPRGGDSLRIGMSADQLADDRDWFDLGVQDLRRGPGGPVRGGVPGAQPGRCVPAARRRRLLLAGQARACRRWPALIEEARALQDQPGRPAADQPVPGRAVGGARRRSASSAARPQRVAAAGSAACSVERRRDRPSGPTQPAGAAARSCGRTSSTDSSGWRSCGSTSSAASSPTTWAWARRCSRWP